MTKTYRGRFAPSPTGPLHFGSLLSALASYLDARANAGIWLVRLEDVDGTRCAIQHQTSIIKTLESYHLISDEEVLVQSNRIDLYEHYLDQLRAQQQLYPCNCTRADLKAFGGLHPKRCNSSIDKPHSWRAQCDQGQYQYVDPIQGLQTFDLALDRNHPVLKRKDDYFSYQLAVVVDDHLQNITDIVRGADLLDTTGQQLWLYDQFGWQTPDLCHLPLIVNETGDKVSKQNHAKAIENGSVDTLRAAFHYLGYQHIPVELRSIEALLTWAIKHWSRSLPKPENLSLDTQDLHFIQ